MALEIHPLEKEDLHLLPALQPEGWGSIVPAHETYLKSSCCFPLKFTDDDKLVGIGTTIVHHDSAWLAHIIVHPAERQKGIGQLITKTLMDAAFSRHCDLLSLIATDLGEPVYTKLGFETDTEYLFFKDVRLKEARPNPLLKQADDLNQPDNLNEVDNLNQQYDTTELDKLKQPDDTNELDNFKQADDTNELDNLKQPYDTNEPDNLKQPYDTNEPDNFNEPDNLKQPDNIEPYQPVFRAELLALDKHISGEDRTIYLQDHLDQGMVYFNNDVLEGFYLPAAGEGMISASTASAGIALMEYRIKTKEVCIFPIDNIIARQYFERNQFEPFRTAKHMVFGKKRTWHPEHIYNRIGGNLG